ncbi:MAG: hypothetical protein ACK476_18580 [Fluviicola sp.]|jgi:hypothetical protein
MKPFLFCIALIFFSNASSKTIELHLNENDGYLMKNEVLDILDNLNLSNKKNFNANWIKDSDTLGRYFKSTETGNYIFCLYDTNKDYDFETHVLVELKPLKENRFKILAKERYFHGNYPCCWNNYYDGFTFENGYFRINTCGTGSGLCGKHAYYFKHVIPQEQLNSITIDYYFYQEDMEAITLESTLVINENYILVSYTLKNITLLELIGDTNEIRTDSEEKFDVLYEYKYNNWTTNDTLNLQKIQI